jgi:hypothetical protein
VIRLGDRGGEASIRVQDTEPSRFIRCTVVLERTNVSGRDLGALQTATREDGEAVAVFVPGGTYQ